MPMPASIFCLTLQTRPFLCLIKPDVMHKLTSIVCSFLTGRGQQCKVNDTVSSLVDIGLSIVQGSGIGRIMYALPALGGFLSAALIDKINAFLSA